MSQRIGGLWKKSTLNGVQYLNGNIDVNGKRIYIAVFPNDRKTKDNAPDYNIVLSETKSKSQEKRVSYQRQQPQPEPEEEDYDDGQDETLPV